MWKHALAALIALTLVTTLVSGVRTSRADFRDTTVNTGSLFEAGVVALGLGSDRIDIDVPLIDPTMLVRDCVEIRYTGDLRPATIGMWATPIRLGGLERFLNVRIEEGQLAATGTCDGFEPSSVAFDGSVADLLAEHGDPATAVSRWTAMDEMTDSLGYRVSISVSSDREAMGLDVAIGLELEATP